MINRLRIHCVSGPWLEEECVRYLDLPDTANLYDLHLAIQDAVQFDDEFSFYFFIAVSPTAKRGMVPAELDDGFEPESIDTDVYEDIGAMETLRACGRKTLFYAFMSEYDDWVFKVQPTGEASPPVDGEFYPLVRDELSVGPNPEQYGSGFDDFAESTDEFKPRPRHLGEADYSPDDERGDEAELFGFGDDEDDPDEDDELDDDEAGDGDEP